MMSKKIVFCLSCLLVVIAFSALKPVPIVKEERALKVAGIVTHIYEGDEKDIVFHLEGINRKYYINRGLELGLEIENLEGRLIGREVIFKYPKYWTPLDWNNRIKHLSKVEFDGIIIFNELK